MPGTTPPTSQLDWLISTTAMIVLFGMPSVIAVLTGSDAERDGLQPIPYRPVPASPHEVPLKSGDGSPFFLAPHPVLAVGKVRHVGEAIAVVVAETMSQATDAAERVEVQYEPLPAVTRSADALAPEGPSSGGSTARIYGPIPRPATRRRRTRPSRGRPMSWPVCRRN